MDDMDDMVHYNISCVDCFEFKKVCYKCNEKRIKFFVDNGKISLSKADAYLKISKYLYEKYVQMARANQND